MNRSNTNILLHLYLLIRDMLDQRRNNLLNRIIEKGGLYGMVAAMCAEDYEKANGFLRECFDQIHNKSLWDFWGRDLILDLIRYRLQYLRFQFHQLQMGEIV